MNEKALGVLEQYALQIDKTFRLRGNYGCETSDGKYILEEYNNSNEKLETMKKLYDYLQGNGFYTDYVIQNRESKYVSVSEDGYTYILKKWYDGEECDICSVEDVCLAVKKLGEFHNLCRKSQEFLMEDKGFHSGKNMMEAFRKHNNEIINIKNYIRKRRNKNYFEMSLQRIIEPYYQQGVLALSELEKSNYEILYKEAIENRSLNHGSYNHHNIMFENKKIIWIHMMKINYAPQIQDLYDFLRKVMEKNGWNISVGNKVLESYNSIRAISSEERQILKAMFHYPEKFWKIINYYYNSNKAWYSEKNEDKLKQFQKQEDLRWKFIEKM